MLDFCGIVGGRLRECGARAGMIRGFRGEKWGDPRGYVAFGFVCIVRRFQVVRAFVRCRRFRYSIDFSRARAVLLFVCIIA